MFSMFCCEWNVGLCYWQISFIIIDIYHNVSTIVELGLYICVYCTVLRHDASKSNGYKHATKLCSMCGRSGSQPANLENVGRRPSLQSAQSDSNLQTGTYQHVSYICMCLWLYFSNVPLCCRWWTHFHWTEQLIYNFLPFVVCQVWCW